MAIFDYDELALRLLLDDPDLAQLKLINQRLCSDLEEQRATFRKQKRELVDTYEAKIRQLEAQIGYVGSKLQSDEHANKVAAHQLKSVHGLVRNFSEGFGRTRASIREALADFGDSFLTVKNAVSEAVGQLSMHEEVCLQQVQDATEYISVLCSSGGHHHGGGAVPSPSASPLVAKTKKKNNKKSEFENQTPGSDDSGLDDPARAAKKAGGDAGSSSSSSGDDSPFEFELDPVEAARQHYRACLEVGPFDNTISARSKRHWQQHDLTAFVRSSISTVTRTANQFEELLKRLQLLSDYATKERSAQAMFELANPDLRNDKKSGGAGFGQEKNDDANWALVALSAATKVASDRRLYMSLFAAAHDTGDDEGGTLFFMADDDRDIILRAERVVRESVRASLSLRFRRIATRCYWRKRIEVYASFRATDVPLLRHEKKKGEGEEVEGKEEGRVRPGPFESFETFDAWKKRLEWFARQHDESFELSLSDCRERTKTLITEMVAKLPSSLLARFVADTNYRPNTWENPFQDFGGNDGGDGGGGFFYDDGTPVPVEANDFILDWQRAQQKYLKSGGKAADGRKIFYRSGGGRRSPRGGGALAEHERGWDSSTKVKKKQDDDSMSATTSTPHSSYLHVKSRVSSMLIDPTSNDNNKNNEDGGEGGERSPKKTLRFSPNVQEVHPDEVIPSEVAAPANRAGFFSPAPPSHFMQTHYHLPSSPSSSPSAGRQRSPMQQINETPLPPSILRRNGGGGGADGSVCVAAGSSGGGNNEQDRQQRFLLEQFNAAAAAGDIPISVMLAMLARQYHDYQHLPPGSGGGRQQYMRLERPNRTNVTGSLQSPSDRVPVDEVGEDDKLMKIMRMRTKATPPPCIISTVGGIGPQSLNEQSLHVSARYAARQFAGQSLVAAARPPSPGRPCPAVSTTLESIATEDNFSVQTLSKKPPAYSASSSSHATTATTTTTTTTPVSAASPVVVIPAPPPPSPLAARPSSSARANKQQARPLPLSIKR